jgi:hypothetical protein
VPLRLLVVVCDTTDPSLRADDELDGIHRAAKSQPGRIHLEVLDGPDSFRTLRDEIRDRAPHVVHLIGHTRQMRADAVIEFAYRQDDGTRRTWELRAGTLRQSWPTGPRLVVLSACRTQQEPATGVPSLTAALRARVSAVIGMTGDIRSDAAVAFARGLYDRLAAGGTVDSAAAAGREEIFADDDVEPDWSYPVLETRSPAGLALPVRLGVDDAEEQTIRRIGEFVKLGRFVDRSEQRRRAWWAIDAEDLPSAAQERPAVLITGPPRYGKTWLAQWSMLTYSLRGRRRQYVDLTGTSQDWLSTLRALRDGIPGCQLSAPMPRFGSFTARLNWLVRRPPTVDMPGPDAPGEEDEYRAFDPNTGQAGLQISTIFADFVDALERSAAERPLVLAIDGTHEIDDDSWRLHVLPRLIRPLVAGRPRVRLLLIMPDHMVTRRLDDDLLPQMARIDLGGFPKAELARIVREYGIRSGWQADVTQRAASFAHDMAGDQVAPEILGKIDNLVLLFGARR